MKFDSESVSAIDEFRAGFQSVKYLFHLSSLDPFV